jgi:hypothetical protein
MQSELTSRSKLFKYRAINDWTKGLIARNEVYFPSAVELDDILDCGINVGSSHDAKRTPAGHDAGAELRDDLRRCPAAQHGK